MTYNFQARFAPMVRDGRKRSTIRRKRKDGKVPKVGEMLHLFTGMRTRRCKLIGAWECEEVMEIYLSKEGAFLDGVSLSEKELESIAWLDGFDFQEEMLRWFELTHGLPFSGHLIQW